MRYRWLPGLAWSHSHSERTNWNRARGPCRRLRSALHLHTLNRVAPLSPRGHTISPTTTEEYSDEGKDVSEEEILRSSLQLPRPPIPGHNVQRSRDEIRANFLRIRPTTHSPALAQPIFSAADSQAASAFEPIIAALQSASQSIFPLDIFSGNKQLTSSAI